MTDWPEFHPREVREAERAHGVVGRDGGRLWGVLMLKTTPIAVRRGRTMRIRPAFAPRQRVND